MKNVISLILIPILLLSFTVQANQCLSYFPPSVIKSAKVLKSESSRLEFLDLMEGQAPKLILEEAGFSKDTDQAVIELVQMLIQNSSFKLEDKNVLAKDKFSLAIPIKDGYFIQLNYESKSNSSPRFVLQDKIQIITPENGKEIKVTDDIMAPGVLKISKSEFDLKNYLPMGTNVKIKVPLVIEGALLAKFAKYASYFKYFQKEELRSLFEKSSTRKIEYQFKYRRAKDVFFNVLIKEPFKMIIGGAFMFAIYNANVIFQKDETQLQKTPAVVTQPMADSIAKTAVPKNNIAAHRQLLALKKEALGRFNGPYRDGLEKADLNFAAEGAFSKDNLMFVYEKQNPYTSSKHTYIVFSQELPTNKDGFEYFMIEVNADKYKDLIAYIKNQEIPAEKK